MSEFDTAVRVAIYYRYSSDKKAQKYNSEKRQKGELIEESLRKGWHVVCVDGDKSTSGDAKNKPQLENLKSLIKSKELLADALYISSWDRLTRKDSLEYAEDVKWLRDAGIKIAIKYKGSNIVSLDDNQQLLLFQMEVYAANQYLKDLSAKVRSGLKERFQRKVLGYARVPFGFYKVETADGKSILPNDDIELVPMVFKQSLNENIQGCVDILKKSKTYMESGNTPTASAVKCILRNTIYIAKRTFGVSGVGKHGTLRGSKTSTLHNVNRIKQAPLFGDLEGVIEPVISDELFFSVQDLLDKNAQEWKNGRRANPLASKFKFAGLLRCSHCDAKMVAEQKKTHVNYVCPQSKSKRLRCSGDVELAGRKMITENQVEEHLKIHLETVWADSDFHFNNFLSAIRLYRRYKRSKSGVSQSQVESLAAKRKNLKDLTERLIERGIEDSMMDIYEGLHKEIADEEKRINEYDQDTDMPWIQELMEISAEDAAIELKAGTNQVREAKCYGAMLFAYAAIAEEVPEQVLKQLEFDEAEAYESKGRKWDFAVETFRDFLRLIHQLIPNAPDLMQLVEETEVRFKFDGNRNVPKTCTVLLRSIFNSRNIRGRNLDKV